MSQMTAELTAELNAPPEPKSRQKRAKKDPATGQRVVGKRGPARPYRKLPDELLTLRVTKLTSRLERVKKQASPSSFFLWSRQANSPRVFFFSTRTPNACSPSTPRKRPFDCATLWRPSPAIWRVMARWLRRRIPQRLPSRGGYLCQTCAY